MADTVKAVHGRPSDSDASFTDDSFDDFGDLDEDTISVADSVRESVSMVFPESPCRDILYEIVVELLSTERAYVDKLHLLVRVVMLNLKILNRVQEEHVLPPDVMKTIFGNLDVIFHFHCTTLLPQLENRISEWRRCPRIGDLMKSVVPFLKLYNTYMENFHKAIQMIDVWRGQNRIFGELLTEIEKTPECRRVPVKQHLIDIVYRVPKYQSTLKDYLHNLASDSPDRKDVEEAYRSVSQTAHELEKAMGKDERIKKLKELQKRLVTNINIVKSSRELRKEGKIRTVAPEKDVHRDRYLFLFNDMVLVCNPSSGVSSKYKVKVSIDIDGLQVQDSNNLCSFYIRTRQKVIEFMCSSIESKTSWVEALDGAVQEYMKWKLAGQPMPKKGNFEQDDLGKRAPTLVHTSSASMCMLCGSAFGTLRKRRHCKGCGIIVCPKCCGQRAPLEYENNRLSRVCDDCFVTLKKKIRDDKQNRSGSEHARATDPAVVSGYLLVSQDKGRSWNKRWTILSPESALYVFKGNQDISPLSSLRLAPGCAHKATKNDGVIRGEGFCVQIDKKTSVFVADSEESLRQWWSEVGKYSKEEH